MRVIQITIDDRLLERLDADREVQRDGRSAVLRRAAAEYLKRKRRTVIREAYQRGYASDGASELASWVGEGSWPDE